MKSPKSQHKLSYLANRFKLKKHFPDCGEERLIERLSRKFEKLRRRYKKVTSKDYSEY